MSLLDPRSIAVIGASDNPHKVGGRPLLYLRRHGYRGAIWPVNPSRAQVQGLEAYPDVASLPDAPELAVVAVTGEDALQAVIACARRGVRTAVVMASGFAETGAAGRALQDRMVAAARATGMRLVGPNCQGLANFSSGMVANFATVFNEVEACDGPVAIVSQSGACSQAIYALARQRGLAVRHVHATGNEADVTAPELALEVVRDDGVGLVLLYLESIQDADMLARAAAEARARDIPIVAVKAGRTRAGERAAHSHTGALANEDRVVDAFFERHGIWRAVDPQALVRAGALYLKRWRPAQGRLLALSNSGASCVMAADAAEDFGLPLAEVPVAARTRMHEVLPGFATVTNPIDVTGALLGNPGMFEALLPLLAEDVAADVVFAALPVAGAGYDVPRFARDFAAHAGRTGAAMAIAAPQPEVRSAFAAAGLPVFEHEREALEALAQLVHHTARMRRAPVARPVGEAPAVPPGEAPFLNEAASLALLESVGIRPVPHRLCTDEDAVRAAVAALGLPVALKACSDDVPHKTEAGLVALGIRDDEAACVEFRRQRDVLRGMGAGWAGIVVARMAPAGHDLALGARVDPVFGPVVMVGAGGIYLEALGDVRVLLPPFDEADVHRAVMALRVAPLLGGVRGEAPRDVAAYARMAVQLGDAMRAWQGRVASVDVNPVRLLAAGEGALALDALVERG